MKKTIQLFSLLLAACFFSFHTYAQTNLNTSATSQAGRNNSGSDIKDINQKLRNSMVQIKSTWQLINKNNREPVYLLFVSKQQLAKAGIKVSTNEAAVPVYVKTDTEYEPVLVENKGQHNVQVVGNSSGAGFIATKDGFVLTTRRTLSPWNSTFEMNLITTPGILMSADLKQVLETNVSAPKNWIPAKTKPRRRGMLGKLNISVGSTGEYTGDQQSFKVRNYQDFKDEDGQPTSVSTSQELGILKLNATGQSAALDLSGDSESLQKGAQNIYIVHLDLADNSPLSKFQSIDVLEKMSAKDFETAQLWDVTPTVVSGIKQIENLGDVMVLKNNLADASGARANALKAHYALYGEGYSGSPVFDGQGSLIGIYLAYDRETDSHRVVPIHIARKFLAGN